MNVTRSWMIRWTNNSLNSEGQASTLALQRGPTVVQVPGPSQTGYVWGVRQLESFNGVYDDHLYYTANVDANTFTNGYSMGGWFKLDQWPIDTAWVFGNYSNVSPNFNNGAVLEVGQPGKFRMRHNATVTEFSPGIRLGQWFHAMLVGDPTGPVQRCYIDGRLVVTSATLPAIALGASTYMYVGTYYPQHPLGAGGGSSGPYAGTDMSVSYFYYWLNTALTGTQVRKIYRNRHANDDVWVETGSRTPMVMS